MPSSVERSYNKLVKYLEMFLASIVLVGICVSAAAGVQVLVGMDWSTTTAFYDFMYRVLLLVIGLELVRMLIVHDLMAVLELLAFIIARKMLKPDIDSLDIGIAVIAFVALLGARRYLMCQTGPTRADKPDDR